VLVTVVTPCSRPENLKLMLPGIETTLFEVTWQIWHNIKHSSPSNSPSSSVVKVDSRVYEHDGGWGYPARNMALEWITDGLVAWLDDDNLIREGFWDKLLHRMIDGFKGVIFGQQWENRFMVASVIPGQVDICQAVFHRSIIGNDRFVLGKETADGHWINDIFMKHGSEIMLDDFNVYYNKLRWSQ